jgi:hypothetical protein
VKQGEHIPRKQRDDLAKVAYGIAAKTPDTESPVAAIAGLFSVSDSTARSLIRRGRFLVSPAGFDKGRAE